MFTKADKEPNKERDRPGRQTVDAVDYRRRS